jgi:DNA invertase Pin-like site-specific DNA recombinase
MSTGKIQSPHYERLAYVYVRQSTPWQVKENRESTKRQYHLHERAPQLGWAASHFKPTDHALN